MTNAPPPDPSHAPTVDGGRPGGWRRWWPALVGVVLAAAAVVGVIVIRSDDTDTTSTTTLPTTTEPAPETTADSTTPPSSTSPDTTAPSPTDVTIEVDGACFSVTTTAGTATGCPDAGAELDHLAQRTFVADLDGPVLVTTAAADPLSDLTGEIDDGTFAARCRWGDLQPRIPDGGIVEIVACNDTGVMGAALATVEPAEPGAHFTVATPYFPDGADLGRGSPIDGLPRALAFTASSPDGVICSILLVPDRSGWKETCRFPDGAPGAAIVQIDPIGIHEIATDDQGLITAAVLLDAVAPSSGCTLDSTDGLLRTLPASSIVGGIGCIDDQASLTTGSVLTQDGPPDGSIWLAERIGDEWTIVDFGTGIDNTYSFPIVPIANWSTWPEATTARIDDYWRAPIVAIPPQPSVEAFIGQLLPTLSLLVFDPEFPLNERIVEARPAGLRLIVAQVDIGGDDSVAGAVLHVWLTEFVDDAGVSSWQASEVLTGTTCVRGIDTTSPERCI